MVFKAQKDTQGGTRDMERHDRQGANSSMLSLFDVIADYLMENAFISLEKESRQPSRRESMLDRPLQAVLIEARTTPYLSDWILLLLRKWPCNKVWL